MKHYGDLVLHSVRRTGYRLKAAKLPTHMSAGRHVCVEVFSVPLISETSNLNGVAGTQKQQHGRAPVEVEWWLSLYSVRREAWSRGVLDVDDGTTRGTPTKPV